jgi:hypothetical protein
VPTGVLFEVSVMPLEQPLAGELLEGTGSAEGSEGLAAAAVGSQRGKTDDARALLTREAGTPGAVGFEGLLLET